MAQINHHNHEVVQAYQYECPICSELILVDCREVTQAVFTGDTVIVECPDCHEELEIGNFNS